MSTRTTTPEIDPARLAAALALLPPIFGRCLEPEATRYSLGAPALVGDHVYATDGRICVRMPATPAIAQAMRALEPRARFPRADTVFEGPGRYDPTPYPLDVLDFAPRCGACGGTGSAERPVQVECPRCEGDCFEPMGDDPDGWEGDICHKCLGEGTVPGKTGLMELAECDNCHGSGLYDEANDRAGMDVHGKALLAFRYLVLLRAAGAVLHFHATEPGRHSVHFVAPGGVEGVFMPMTRDPR